MPKRLVCSGCEQLPKLVFSESDVYVHLPTDRHLVLVERELTAHGYSFSRVDGGLLVPEVDFESFLGFLSSSVFNTVEKKDVKVLPLQRGEALSFAAIRNLKSLSEWEIIAHGQDVVSIIDEARIKTLFQPIIRAQTGEIYGYEALSRGILPDGSIMSPARLFSQAKAMDLLFYLDRACREASLRAAARQGITRKIFINFVPTAIYEPTLCLQTTARVLAEEGLDSEQVVFEVVETEKVEDFGHLNRILDYYRDKGYSTALDDIGSGFSDVGTLLQLRPDYMKIDMEVIRDIHLRPHKQELLDVFIENGKKIGLSILAEGIETLEEYRYLRERDVDLMQGYLFGKPEEVPVATVRMPE
ncbi:EAL domain-containing protein [Leucobacter sp. Z1108]|uniref:EAL domain-containing protein n=1 Tax=Leucobacter sp. Z1108 TaxID=3439066 RepID=UPI003F2D29C2